MNLKIIVYILVIPLSVWALDSINFNNLFKKNRYYSSRVLVFMLSMALSYLVVNFIFDVFANGKIITF